MLFTSRRTLLALACSLVCTACVTVHVKDVTFVSVSPADPKDAPTPYLDRPDFLRVRFRTSSNLNSVYRQAQAAGAFVRITLCPFDEDHMVGFSSIYFRG